MKDQEPGEIFFAYCFIGYERSTLEGPGSTAQMMKLAILLTMTLLNTPSALVDTHYFKIYKIYI